VVRLRPPVSTAGLRAAPGQALGLARRAAGETVTQAREQLRGHDQPYATPPPGSDLQPILGDPGPPVIGYSLAYFGDPLVFARRRYDRYGPVSWSRAFGIRLVSVLGPEAAGEVLANRDKAFANGPGWEYFIGPFFRRGLMLLDFEEHLHHRRIMQQAFTRDRLVSYLKGMNAVLGDGFDAWEPRPGFRFHPAFKQLTLDLATTVFVGHHLGPEADQLNRAFFDTVQAGTAFVRAPVPGGRWHKGLQGRRVLEDFFRAELPAKKDGQGDDLFTALCHATDEDGNTFSDDDVVNHMIFLLMAAHDTSTTTMTTLVYELARNRAWQDRLREESRALGTDHIEYEDLERLPSHAMAIKEAQRILAPVPSMARYAVRDTELLGHFVPKGARLGLYPYFTMRMEEYWSDPATFDPDRFSPERREEKVHPYAWMPFGGGVHKCIGMHFGNLEVTSALHQFLLRYEWAVPDGYEMPVNLTSLPYPDDGLPIDLRPVRT
jgi:cytochrome P450